MSAEWGETAGLRLLGVEEAGRTLGELRQEAVEAAGGDYVIQCTLPLCRAGW